MPPQLTVEELAIDDSFINYCFKTSEEDVLKWQTYIKEHPFEVDTINEAKKFVVALKDMLKEQHGTGENKQQIPVLSIREKIPVKRIFFYAAAIIAIIYIGTLTFISSPDKPHLLAKLKKADSINEIKKIYTTANGEKKSYSLPDGTKFTLNSGSELTLSDGFGKDNRTVFLNGEALFDVVHNTLLPFIVKTDKCSIQDVGTVFNVYAYAGEKTCEASLIKGSIEIWINNHSKKILLSPYQKIIIDSTDFKSSSLQQLQTPTSNNPAEIKVLPVSFSNSDSTIIETAWSQNRLEIVNERFAVIRTRLERWYDVNIDIKDDSVADYTFTATFEKKETIEEVLKALQYSYHFSYSIKGDNITVSK